MRIVLPIRTGSAPVHASPVYASPRISFSDHGNLTGILFHGKDQCFSLRSSLHLEIKERKDHFPTRSGKIRRALSENDMIRSVGKISNRFGSVGRRSFPARISEDEDLSDYGSLILKNNLLRREEDCGRDAEILVGGDAVEAEIEFSGGGIGKGRKIGGGGGQSGGGGGGGGGADQRKIGEYYREMLKANPGNPLLLRNYGKFLHEVDGDVVRAEECYARAILASPNDGEVLSLYAKLIWETRREEERAEAYFDRAVQAAPDDCYVLGAYAQFLWDAEDEEEEAQERKSTLPSALVEAF